jgi:hypothetical protein
MDEDPSLLAEFDPTMYGIVGNICSDWAILEYEINKCIWRLAAIFHDQLGSCITAQIPGFNGRMEALILLARERGISNGYIKSLNKFLEDSRGLLEARNRAAHDPVAIENGKHVQLQITARGKSVFEIREITREKLTKDRDDIDRLLKRFSVISREILAQLPSLPYTPKIVFPQISRAHGQIPTN